MRLLFAGCWTVKLSLIVTGGRFHGPRSRFVPVARYSSAVKSPSIIRHEDGHAALPYAVECRELCHDNVSRQYEFPERHSAIDSTPPGLRLSLFARERPDYIKPCTSFFFEQSQRLVDISNSLDDWLISFVPCEGLHFRLRSASFTFILSCAVVYSSVASRRLFTECSTVCFSITEFCCLTNSFSFFLCWFLSRVCVLFCVWLHWHND